MDPKSTARRLRILAGRLDAPGVVPRQHVMAALAEIKADLTLSRTAARSIRLDRRTLRDVNRQLDRKGLDGNKPFRSFGLGLGEVVDVLGRAGIFIDDVIHKPLSPDGRDTYPLRYKPDDAEPLDPGQIVGNTMLVLTWHQFEETGNWEMIAYLS